MILVADTTGEAVDQVVVARDRVLRVVDLVVPVVRFSSDEHLEMHEVPTDLVNICVIINMCVIINSCIVTPAP